jgi:hypothetical protein
MANPYRKHHDGFAYGRRQPRALRKAPGRAARGYGRRWREPCGRPGYSELPFPWDRNSAQYGKPGTLPSTASNCRASDEYGPIFSVARRRKRRERVLQWRQGDAED